MIDIFRATTPEHFDHVRSLWERYWSDMGFTPCFQGFETELATLPGRYAGPGGCLLLALNDGHSAGAAGYRKLDDATCEAKRLYVGREFRGRNLGELLMLRLVEEARAAGYVRLVGDTLPVMVSALALYDRMGFRRIDSYPGSTPGAICIELPI